MVEYLPAKMIIYLFIATCFCQAVFSQKLIVTHAPRYVEFQEQKEPLQTSEVPKVISHTLGLPSQSDIKWKGLLQGSFFQRPKANVLVTVQMMEGQPDLRLAGKAEFPVNLDNAGVDVGGLMTSLQGNFMDKNPLMLDAGLDNSIFDIHSEFDVFRKLPNTLRRMADRLLDADSIAQEHTTGTLNTSLTSDLSLMGELQMIQDVLKTVQGEEKLMKTHTPDFYSFSITGLQGVAEKHGKQSTQSKDASDLVTDFLHKMTEQFKILYKDNVVVEILMVNPPSDQLIRKVRSLKAAEETKNVTGHNLAADVDEMYPVTFNICLWLMILLAIAVFGVCYSIWNMDPGRDSIIYRMTTTRLKKD
ncbi:renin receptor-like [Mercenaria mercenaria]|uniref:renin receptor-like n=1 Tax=Mercenaria mercenaria TaxID=6596 RepID=UPI00234FAFE5|nr:renin receptor-like [Mercenaria mercenaria]